jgi:hypothetical protein
MTRFDQPSEPERRKGAATDGELLTNFGGLRGSLLALKRLFHGPHAQPVQDRTSCLPLWLLWLAAAIFLSIAGIYAYTTSFTLFSPYDDEGFMMISVQGFMHGHALYDQVLTPYGPFYYLYHWFLHAVAMLPITHDVTRAICIFHWLLASCLLALAGARMTRSVLLGFFVFIQAVLHLTLITREPTHPQELVAVMLGLAALVANAGPQRKLTLPLLAAIGAAVTFTKINIGAFYGLALVLAMCCHAPRFQSCPAQFCWLLALSSLVPFALMRPYLAQDYFYAIQVWIAIVTAGVIAYTFHTGPNFNLAHIFRAGVVFLSLSAFFISFLLFTGSSLSATVDFLVIVQYKLGSRFHGIFRAPHCLWWGAVSLLSAAAAVFLRSRFHRWKPFIASAKGLYGLVGTMVLLFRYNHYGESLGYLLPWGWLLLVPTEPGDSSDNSGSFPRIFICLLAAWQSLQAYPVSGTQAVIATFLPVLIYCVCLHDAFKTFMEEPWTVQELARSPQALWLIEVLVLGGLLYLSLGWCKPLFAWRRYKYTPPIGLRGSEHLHTNWQADTYRALSQYLETESDAFITIPGFNSLYFWTGKNAPTFFNTSFIWVNDQQQAQVIADLQKARRPLIVVNDNPMIRPVDRGTLYAYPAGPAGPLPRFIQEQCYEVKTIGSFRILALKETTHPRATLPSVPKLGSPSSQ